MLGVGHLDGTDIPSALGAALARWALLRRLRSRNTWAGLVRSGRRRPPRRDRPRHLYRRFPTKETLVTETLMGQMRTRMRSHRGGS